MTLQNATLTLTLDKPGETYRMSRFDWNGFISSVAWKGITLTGREKPAAEQDNTTCGYGLHNEFGIEDPVGFSDCPIGGWYLKIGIGLLKKDGLKHDFYSPHEIQPIEFSVREEKDSVLFNCRQTEHRGYGYRYDKKISLKENTFKAEYTLTNTGTKDIVTDEYCHNFLALADEPTGPDLEIGFPFPVDQTQLIEAVNPENLILWKDSRMVYTGTPEEQYFFSNLTAGDIRKAEWSLTSLKHKLRLTETGNFDTSKINLWGWRHVVSPELFRKINLRRGETAAWTRTWSITPVN